MAEANSRSAETQSAKGSPSKALPPTSSRLSEKDKEKEKNLSQLIEQLRQRVKDVQPLPDEPNFFMLDETLVRFVRAREYNLKDAEKQLRHTIDWRRKHRPLNTTCRGCRKKPGLHSIRQVGYDLEGRPVIYMCFEQCASLRQSVEVTVEHMVELCESTIAAFREGCPQSWTWVVDCRGISLTACNPAMAQEVLGLLSTCYPEFLHRVVVTNHNTVFHNFWKMIKVFIDPKTIDKVRLIRKREKLNVFFESMFSRDLIEWLFEEIRLNGEDKICDAQKRFYAAPTSGVKHDPRGTAVYVQQCIEPFAEKYKAELELLKKNVVVLKRVHRPHPNTADELLGAKNDKLLAEDSQVNIPLISPAFDFLREVMPFGKDGGENAAAKEGADDQSVSSAANTSEKQSENGEISDDEPQDEAESEAQTQSQTQTQATADSGNDALQKKQPDSVTDSVMGSLSSATNKISIFFRDLGSETPKN